MYIQYQPGIAAEDSYPYEANDVSYACRYKSDSSVGSTTGYARILPGNETLLKDVVAAVGPVAFGLNAETNTFLSYR